MPVATPGIGDARGRSPLALLAVRDFRVWWLGFVVSTIAIFTQAFGVGWLVLELSAPRGGAGTAAFYLGMIGLARAVPTIALGAFAGVAGDRYDRRNVLVAAQAALAGSALATGLLVVSHLMNIALLLVLSAFNAVGAAFYHAVRQVIQPRLVGEANLMGAIGMNGSALNVAALVGPLIGGSLVLAVGVGGLMLACGIASGAVAVSLATLRAQPVDPADSGSGSILRSFSAGLGYARRTPLVLWLLTMFAVITLLMRPLPFMLPALAHDVLDVGPRQLSWLVSAAGAGAIASGLVLTWLRPSPTRAPRAALVVAIAAGLSLSVLAMQRSLPAALVLVATTQFFVGQACGRINAITQITTPDQFRGRIVGLQSLLADGGTECGVFLIGAVGGAVGISAALGASGGVLALLCLAIAIGVPVIVRTPASAVRPAQQVEPT